MIKKLIVVLGLLACAPGAMAQNVKQFNQYIQGLPSATLPLNPGDELYVLQGGTSKHVPQSGLGGSSGGVGNGAFTRAQIPTIHSGGASFIVNGYSVAKDLGDGAPYTCSGQSSASWNAIQDADGIWCGLDFAATQQVNPGWFGAKADDGATTIAAGDITANPQWRGTYSAGTTWDTVGNQEAKYAAYATNSTPGSITWNISNGHSNIIFFVPPGTYGINVQIFSVETGGVDIFGGKNNAFWHWKGATNVTMWLCDSCAYTSIYGMSVKGGDADYLNSAPLIDFDHDGSSPGGLHTQQDTFYDMFCNVSANGECMAINAVALNSQGDTVTFVNPVWIGNSLSDYALFLGGDNTLQITVLGGDCQGFSHICIFAAGGTFETYGLHFENQNLNYDTSAPYLTQMNTNGGDVLQSFGVANNLSSIHNARTESTILLAGHGSITNIDSAWAIGSDANLGWGANGYVQVGKTIFPGTNNAKNRSFMLVDNGGTPWLNFTSVDGTKTILTDSVSGTSSTLNQWAGYDLAVRFGGNAFVEHCTIASNTATSGGTTTFTVTPSGCLNFLGGAAGQQMYQINGITGASAPNWDSAAKGDKTATNAVNGANTGFATGVGSNQVGVGNFTQPGVNDYVVIPGADGVNPPAGGIKLPMALFAKVTGTSGTGCQGMPKCITINKNALYAVGGTNNGSFGYFGTPISDGTTGFMWLDLEFDSVYMSGGHTNGVYMNFGKLGGTVTSTNDTFGSRQDWNDTRGAVGGYHYALDMQFRQSLFCAATPGSTVDLTGCLLGVVGASPPGGNFVSLTPAQDETISAPVLTNITTGGGNADALAADFTLLILGSGTNRVLTFGTGFSGVPVINTGTNSGIITVRFTYDGVNGAWRQVASSIAAAGTNSTAASPAGPNSTSVFTMQGLAGAITPTRTGNINLQVCGTLTETGITTAGTGLQYQLSYGTSTAPTTNAALTGTQVGTVGEYMLAQTVTAADVFVPTCQTAVVTGLTVGTGYWIDLAAKAIVNAAFALSNVNIAAHEF